MKIATSLWKWWTLRNDVDETIKHYLAIHKLMISSPRFWYDRELRNADRIICVAASDLKKKKQQERSSGG